MPHVAILEHFHLHILTYSPTCPGKKILLYPLKKGKGGQSVQEGSTGPGASSLGSCPLQLPAV